MLASWSGVTPAATRDPDEPGPVRPRIAYRQVSVPTSVLCGDQDARAPLPVAESLHAAIPGSELVVLDGVGRVSAAEAPERFNAAIRPFLRRSGP